MAGEHLLRRKAKENTKSKILTFLGHSNLKALLETTTFAHITIRRSDAAGLIAQALWNSV